MGRGDVKVSILPITFSSQQDGAFNLNLYKVEGANGDSRYVDNTGKVYKDLGDWKQNNGLPPGKMTYPADGKLGAPGQTTLITEDTPKAHSAGWDRFTRGAALVGAAAAGGLLILGTEGAGTPAALALPRWGHRPLSPGPRRWAPCTTGPATTKPCRCLTLRRARPG